MLTAAITVSLLFSSPFYTKAADLSPDARLASVDRETSAASGVAVTLECTAYANGRVGHCKVLGETHPGLGFGEAAIAMVEGSTVAPGRTDIQFARTIQFTP